MPGEKPSPSQHFDREWRKHTHWGSHSNMITHRQRPISVGACLHAPPPGLVTEKLHGQKTVLGCWGAGGPGCVPLGTRGRLSDAPPTTVSGLKDLGTRPTSFTCRGPGLESANTGGKKEQQGMALLAGGPKSPFWGWDQLSVEAAYKTKYSEERRSRLRSTAFTRAPTSTTDRLLGHGGEGTEQGLAKREAFSTRESN